jgi:predicted site-specific integrase-resolvase
MQVKTTYPGGFEPGQIVTVEEAAQALGLCEQTIRLYAKEGLLVGMMLKKQWRIVLPSPDAVEIGRDHKKRKRKK